MAGPAFNTRQNLRRGRAASADPSSRIPVVDTAHASDEEMSDGGASENVGGGYGPDKHREGDALAPHDPRNDPAVRAVIVGGGKVREDGLGAGAAST